ncbi:hypothetical protein GCM10018962_60000 [Dactylosporangium matsuzakiense]|uniref:Uncharacterized protein n=1 Tax=Dactylosporangium matsuzakiense TaxID=53360 RepID=A0A9W6NQU2_9ACTN|nr:hypothetical protein GCM10017581_083000 [Dactylosporangium matsuzakiense]
MARTHDVDGPAAVAAGRGRGVTVRERQELRVGAAGGLLHAWRQKEVERPSLYRASRAPTT